MAEAATAERKPATPEEIWEILRETASRQKEHEEYWAELRKERKEEAAREAARREAEAKREVARQEAEAKREAARRAEEAARQEEWAKKWAELWKGFDQTKELINGANEKMGGLEETLGKVVEHLVAPGIEDRLGQYGLAFENVYPNAKVKENRQTIAEIDLLLEGNDARLAVEIKAKVRTGDVKDHAARLAKLREHYDRRDDRHRLFGAMAGAVFNSMERKSALSAGFFVIVQSGDTMKMDIPEGFKPREW